MATLEEIIENLDLPVPVTDGQGNGEDLNSYVRRIAYIGALAGKQHTLTHTPPAIIRVPIEVGAPGLDDLPDA